MWGGLQLAGPGTMITMHPCIVLKYRTMSFQIRMNLNLNEFSGNVLVLKTGCCAKELGQLSLSPDAMQADNTGTDHLCSAAA